MHMSIIYAWTIMAQNNNIAVQVVAHDIDILAMRFGCMYAGNTAM
jgi:hypothetical protein